MSSPDGGNAGGNVSNPSNINAGANAPKIALVKPTDGKGATVQPHQFRTLAQQPMRVVMPSGAVQTAGTTQIIQTHIMPQAMIKQVDALGRSQMVQSSINTLTRPITPNPLMPRGVTTVTNISANRGTIRAQTPPISTVTTGFVRGAIPPRTPSPAGTVIPGSATTWMSGNQPVQLIRASIGHSPRTRIVSQTIPAVSAAVSSATNISANIVSSQSVSQSQAPSSVAIQTVSSNSAASNIVSQPQTFVAVASTLATVLPPRQQTATLVYSNPQQFGASGPGQRLAVANPITAQRQVRPIQISNTRLPASGLGVRVSNGNISIRGPNNIPVLAPSSVLTTLPSGTSTTVTASNITAVTGLPAARIIQVQQPNTGGTAQVLSTGRITGNLMTLHPLVMNASAANTSNVRGTSTTTKPSLTITHVGKVTTPSSSISQQGNVQLTTTNLSQGTTITAAMPTSSSGSINQQQSQQQQSNSATTTPIGIVMGTNVSQTGAQPHQIAQIVNLNQSGINVGHGHQIQIIGSQSHTPITSRTNTSVATMPASSAHIVRMATTTSNTTSNSATVLPIAKVLPQQQQSVNEHSSIVTVSSVGNAQNVYIHSRSPSNPPTASSMATSTIVNPQTGSIISAPSGTYYMPVSSSSTSGNASIAISTAAVQTVTTNSSTIATSIPLNTTSLSASYAPQSGSFAVVTSSNRNTSSAATTSSQSIPVRFNPSVVVDANAHSVQGAIISMQQPMVHSNQQQVQKSSHVLIPASGTKAVMVTASPRTQNVIATASRKRDQYGEFVPSSSTSSNQIPLTKNAVKNLNTALASLSEQQASQQRPKSPVSRPGSSDGSTTVSANSSPGVDRQEEEALALNALHRNNRNISDGAQFATSQTVNVPQMQANNSAYANSGHIMNAFRPQPTLATVQPKPLQPTDRTATTSRNGNIDELTPRKRARKQQLSEYSNASIAKRYPNSSPATGFGIDSTVDSEDVTFANKHTADASSLTSENEAISKGIDTMENASNAANDSANKTVDFVIKKPKTCALIDSYKQSWKATSNHFQRYSDVKPREERRPTVVDLANQAQVVQKVNGWKIYHLSSQMEDLTELETQVYDKLSSMLQQMEAHNQSSDVDRVNELIKGNMQRSKIVSDSINEARLQILKVFDHKSHVSDIIHRCASKRNFKKREKA